jgi:hypothetical protein
MSDRISRKNGFYFNVGRDNECETRGDNFCARLADFSAPQREIISCLRQAGLFYKAAREILSGRM